MKTIWKFPVEITDYQTIEMPANAQILAVQMQGSTPQLWAIVHPEAQVEKRYFRVYGTGHRVDQVGNFIGTFQMHGGSLVWHMFEVGSWERD